MSDWTIMYEFPLDKSDWTVDDHIEWIRQDAGIARFMNEVKLNTMLTTWAYYDGIKGTHNLDIVTTTEKFRAMGVIR